MKKIPLSKGKFALVDDLDYEKVVLYKWSFTDPGYAYRNEYSKEGRKRIYLHRYILGVTEKGLIVDHINGDPLDNQRDNLRVCNHSQNMINRRTKSNSSSGYKGVSWDKKRDKWISYICPNGKFISLGRYDCKHRAARAYNKKSLEIYGDFAKINVIERCSCDECITL